MDLNSAMIVRLARCVFTWRMPAYDTQRLPRSILPAVSSDAQYWTFHDSAFSALTDSRGLWTTVELCPSICCTLSQAGRSPCGSCKKWRTLLHLLPGLFWPNALQRVLGFRFWTTRGQHGSDPSVRAVSLQCWNMQLFFTSERIVHTPGSKLCNFFFFCLVLNKMFEIYILSDGLCCCHKVEILVFFFKKGNILNYALFDCRSYFNFIMH